MNLINFAVILIRTINTCLCLDGSSITNSNNSNAFQISQTYLTANNHQTPLVIDPVDIDHKQQVPLNTSRAATGYMLNDDFRSKYEKFSLPKPTNLSVLASDEYIDFNLTKILNRDSPDLRISRDIREFDESTLKVSKRAWSLLHSYAAKAIRDRFALAKPAIDELLISANVSLACRKSADETFLGALRMESWAIKLINSWGTFPPDGIFEGTYTSIGSYQDCVNVPKNKHINHAHYCTIAFRPVMPKRDKYDLIVNQEAKELLDLFSRSSPNTNLNVVIDDPADDVLTDLLKHAQYFHYLYLKWGTCWPIDCSPYDVKRVAKLIGRRNILMNGPTKCYSLYSEDYEYKVPLNYSASKFEPINESFNVSVWNRNKENIFVWKPHFYTAHLVAASILAFLTFTIVLITLIDIILIRLPRIFRTYREYVKRFNPEPPSLPSSSSPSLPLDDDITATNAIDLINKNPFHDHVLYMSDKQLHGTTCMDSMSSNNNNCQQFNSKPIKFVATNSQKGRQTRRTEMSKLGGLIDDCSIITNAGNFFRISESQLKNDILCINGIRSITMLWVVTAHTLMYNDWSAFARTREIEIALKSILIQPVFNGTYVVDSFFLMSGLLSAYTTFRHSRGAIDKFSSFGFIITRWLRLTPQLVLVSMMHIILPTLSHGPHWYPIVGEFSENCIRNWWVNVLHLQAFYRQEEMCNFVTWWISIDYFYHFMALAIIWIILLIGHRAGSLSLTMVLLSQVGFEALRHYQLELPPNVLSTIPQSGAMWSEMILGFFWTPYAHAVPFFFGFYSGYLMALRRSSLLKLFNFKRAIWGWTISISCLLSTSMATFPWVTGAIGYTRLISTIFWVLAPIIWSGSICWIIIACHHGYGGIINTILSNRAFIIGAKASYLIYLSHFLVIFVFFGNSNILMEPSPIMMSYIIMGNVFISTVLGIVLCIVFEIPWLKFQRRIVNRLL